MTQLNYCDFLIDSRDMRWIYPCCFAALMIAKACYWNLITFQFDYIRNDFKCFIFKLQSLFQVIIPLLSVFFFNKQKNSIETFCHKIPKNSDN